MAAVTQSSFAPRIGNQDARRYDYSIRGTLYTYKRHLFLISFSLTFHCGLADATLHLSVMILNKLLTTAALMLTSIKGVLSAPQAGTVSSISLFEICSRH